MRDFFEARNMLMLVFFNLSKASENSPGRLQGVCEELKTHLGLLVPHLLLLHSQLVVSGWFS